MSTSHYLENNREREDAKKVDQAVEAMLAGEIDEAECFLLEVIENTPSDYVHVEEDEEGVYVKFWDQIEFLHYIEWGKTQGGARKSTFWVGNAYPRAHYYLGFLSIERKQFDRALDFLEKGQMLEPTNPRFLFEKAHVFMHIGRNMEALALYDQVTAPGPHVGARELAKAMRGRGSVLIELERFEEAEAAFLSSLEIQPDNETALRELCYLEKLRQGADATNIESVTAGGRDLSTCAVCDRRFEQGEVVSVNGVPTVICKRCVGKITKKWWQFWK